MDFHAFGKGLVAIGLLLLAVGLAIQFLPRLPYVGRLPGDILIKRDHFMFYFPLTTCILVSLVLMILSRFFGRK